jgi:hypothetical protein
MRQFLSVDVVKHGADARNTKFTVVIDDHATTSPLGSAFREHAAG